MSGSSETRAVWLIAGLLTGLSLLNHLISPSSFHLSAEAWDDLLAYHRDFDVFRVRPVTTAVVGFLAEQTGLSVRSAFFLLQFALFFVTGPAFYHFLRSLQFSPARSRAGMVILLLSLPLFLAHFEPVWTWDDFWCYILLPSAMAFALGRRYWPAAACIAGAMIARETSAAFLPVLFLLFRTNPKVGIARPLLATLAPVAVLVVFRAAVLGAVSGSPVWSLAFNFESWARTRDSLFSLIVSLGFLWPVGLTQAFRRPEESPAWYDAVRFGALLTAGAYLVSGLLFGHIRESRLLLPPALLFIPLVLVYIEENGRRLGELRAVAAPGPLRTAIALGLLLAGSLLAAHGLFPSFEYRRWQDGKRLYFALHLALTAVFLGVEFMRRGRGRSPVGRRPGADARAA